MSSDSDSGGSSFIERLCASVRFFVKVDEEFIEDGFNLTGLRKIVPEHYQEALNVILDVDAPGEIVSSAICEHAATVLYGLIHARFLTTARGLQLLYQKYERAEFGRCCRYFCEGQHLLPMGLSDVLAKVPVKLFCPRCQELYNAPDTITNIDGAFFGTSATPMLLLAHPSVLGDKKKIQKSKEFTMKIYGFQIHANSNLNLKEFRKVEPKAPPPLTSSNSANSVHNNNSNNNNNDSNVSHVQDDVKDDVKDEMKMPKNTDMKEEEEEEENSSDRDISEAAKRKKRKSLEDQKN